MIVFRQREGLAMGRKWVRVFLVDRDGGSVYWLADWHVERNREGNAMPDDAATYLRGIIDRLKAGDPPARAELINTSCQRLSRLAYRLFQDSRRLERWIDVDDVVQESLLRLNQALQRVELADVRHRRSRC